jgi:hypothetical protein
MQTFDIEITEISTRIIQIDANTITEAMEIAGLLYKREEIQLELSDHKRTEIDITEMKAYNHEAMNQFLKKRHLQQLRYWILKNWQNSHLVQWQRLLLNLKNKLDFKLKHLYFPTIKLNCTFVTPIQLYEADYYCSNKFSFFIDIITLICCRKGYYYISPYSQKNRNQC